MKPGEPEPDQLYYKYAVVRTDGRDRKGEKHEGCAYLVLDLTHDVAARFGALEYAARVVGYRPGLASDIRQAVMRAGGVPE